MQNLVNKKEEKWLHPWNKEKFDELAYEDDRFFSIVIKGAMAFLTRNIVMYNKPIKHFIFNTGSSYLYIESNGYEYTTSETSGEDTIYMSTPRCLVDVEEISIPTEELTQPFVRGTYERRIENSLNGMNAEMRRLPIEIGLSLKYVVSTYNEALVLVEELCSKMIFNKYFNIVYLGNVIRCSIDFPTSNKIEINKIDMTSSETNQKTIDLSLKIATNYPQIQERTEMHNDDVIANYGNIIMVHPELNKDAHDIESRTYTQYDL